MRGVFENPHVLSSCGVLDDGLWDEACEPCESPMWRDSKVRLVLVGFCKRLELLVDPVFSQDEPGDVISCGASYTVKDVRRRSSRVSSPTAVHGAVPRSHLH